MKRKEENRSVIEPSCTFFKPNKINFLPSNWVLDRKADRVTGYKVLIDLTSLIYSMQYFDRPIGRFLIIDHYLVSPIGTVKSFFYQSVKTSCDLLKNGTEI
jgi:hypothetical protein